MTEPTEDQYSPEIIAEVDRLSDEVKSLTVDIALVLARIRARSADGKLDRLEPDFLRLVNNSVKAIREIAIILNAAQNREKMVYDVPSGRLTKDRLETRLHGILEQTNRLLESLAQMQDFVA